MENAESAVVGRPRSSHGDVSRPPPLTADMKVCLAVMSEIRRLKEDVSVKQSALIDSAETKTEEVQHSAEATKMEEVLTKLESETKRARKQAAHQEARRMVSLARSIGADSDGIITLDDFQKALVAQNRRKDEEAAALRAEAMELREMASTAMELREIAETEAEAAKQAVAVAEIAVSQTVAPVEMVAALNAAHEEIASLECAVEVAKATANSEGAVQMLRLVTAREETASVERDAAAAVAMANTEATAQRLQLAGALEQIAALEREVREAGEALADEAARAEAAEAALRDARCDAAALRSELEGTRTEMEIQAADFAAQTVRLDDGVLQEVLAEAAEATASAEFFRAALQQQEQLNETQVGRTVDRWSWVAHKRDAVILTQIYAARDKEKKLGWQMAAPSRDPPYLCTALKLTRVHPNLPEWTRM